MLLNLHVKNLALIEEVDVDFTSGLVVLTGETGAGKSLILGSINLALGEKAAKNIIRTGCDFALVELTFSCNDIVKNKLKELDIYTEDEEVIVVSRRITLERSVAKINGETVNLKTLKAIMSLLVNIHGQNDNQTLLKVNNHLDFIDGFASDKVNDLKETVKSEYSNFTQLKTKLKEIQIDEGTRSKELEFAKFEVDEIEKAALKEDEDEILERDFKKMAGAQNTSEALSRVYANLSDSANGNISSLIDTCINELSSINDEEVEEFKKSLYDIDALVNQLSSDVYSYNETLNFDPSEVSEIEKRLDLINKLKIKYGNSISSINEYLDDRKQYIEKLENIEEELNSINRQISESEEKLEQYSFELSKARKESALVFEKEVVKALSDLNFLSAEFKVDFKRKDYSSNGFDEVEFMLSTNPGEPIKPLAIVASGGELSRIMLAIKSVMAKEDEVDTLIFDEIDAGISGNTALKVADKLGYLSKKNQVLCISHLAQIAAMADSHYLIAKSVNDGHTFTDLKLLSDDEIIRELARISSGEVSDISLQHAKELKSQALAKK